jgi:hypothetical protein
LSFLTKLNSPKCLDDAFPSGARARIARRFDKYGKNLPSLRGSSAERRTAPRLGPRDAFRLGLSALLLGCALAAGVAFADAEKSEATEPFAYSGDWYVLIHYRESGLDAPVATQWDDQIWRFSRVGDRLRWTIFPDPEFRDSTGREERAPGGEWARSSGAWRPSAAQTAEIEKGLAWSDRDEWVKRLVPSREGGWTSASRRPSASVSQLAYHELWRIEENDQGPTFSRVAALGSGRAKTLEAGTRFIARGVAPGGEKISGEYLREGEREGVFEMLRMSGPGR